MFLGCCDDVVLLFIAHISHPHRPQHTAFYFFVSTPLTSSSCFQHAQRLEPRVDMRATRDFDKGASKDILWKGYGIDGFWKDWTCAFLFLHFDKTVIQAFPEQPACRFRKGRNQSSAKKRKKKECYILTCVRVCVHWVDFRGSEAVVISCAGHLCSFWYCSGFRKSNGNWGRRRYVVAWSR